MFTKQFKRMLAPATLVALSATISFAQTPIAHWTFDEGIFNYSTTSSAETTAGDAGDAIWAEAGGAGLSWGVGQIGGAAFLDGAVALDHHFEIATNSVLNNLQTASFSAWFRPDFAVGQSGDVYKGIFTSRFVEDSTGTNTNWGINYRSNSDQVNTRASNASLDSTDNVVADGSWYHAVLTFDGANEESKLYVNGVDQGAVATDAIGIVFGNTWIVGQDPLDETGFTKGSERHFRGGVDDYAMYSTVLTPAQVTTIYNNGLGNGTSSTNAAGVASADFVFGDVTGATAGSAPDGNVDQFDYFAIRDNMNTVATSITDGDADGNGLVDLNDFAVWRNIVSPAGLAAAGLAVPEPSSMLLMSLVGLLGFGRVRRGQR